MAGVRRRQTVAARRPGIRQGLDGRHFLTPWGFGNKTVRAFAVPGVSIADPKPRDIHKAAGAEVVIVEITPPSTQTAASELDYAKKYLQVGTGYCNGGTIIVISPAKKEILWSVTPKFGAQDADMKAFADAVTGHFDGGDFNKAFISELKMLLEKAKQPARAQQCPGPW